MLLRANRFIVDIASQYPVLWKKLDEEDRTHGIQRKSFTKIYQAFTSPKNQARFLYANFHYLDHRDEIIKLSDEPKMHAIIQLLHAEESRIERRVSELLKRRISYRWFSFLRRHRSAWKNVMGGFFEVSGRAIADLHQPGIKPRGAPKRIHASLQLEILKLAKPGDVFITRHDDALSNWFLPGFWPHAALYLGEPNQIPNTHQDLPAGPCFLEAKKDGVKIRPISETLAVDALIVLRPPMKSSEITRGLERALSHKEKPYDFLFDFRTADRLVCTEVIYRGFHGIDPVQFELREVGGRLCLPAEELVNQALKCQYQIILSAGIGQQDFLTGSDAQRAFSATRT